MTLKKRGGGGEGQTDLVVGDVEFLDHGGGFVGGSDSLCDVKATRSENSSDSGMNGRPKKRVTHAELASCEEEFLHPRFRLAMSDPAAGPIWSFL